MNIKILIAEHDKTDVELIQYELDRGNVDYTSQVVKTEEEFINALNVFAPDVILSDYTFPSFSGSSAFLIREKLAPHVPFIMVSGTIGEENSIELIRNGVTDFILKDRLFTMPLKIKRALGEVKDRVARKNLEEENLYKAGLLKNIGQAVMSSNMEGIVTYWNNAAEQIFGWTAEETIGNNLLEFIPLEQTKELSLKILSELHKGNIWTGELEMQRKDGSSFTALLNDSPVFDSSGRLTGIIGIATDITERKKAEEKVLKAQRLYALLSQINQTIVHVTDENVLFRNACRIATEYGKFEMAWIGIFDIEQNTIVVKEQQGITEDLLQILQSLKYAQNGAHAHIIRTGTYYNCKDISKDENLANWRPFAEKHGLKSGIALPIKRNGSVIGTFNLYSKVLNFADEEELSLLTEIAGDISFAIENFEKNKKHQQTEALVLANEKRFRALIEKSTDMKTLVTAEGIVTYGSPSIEKVLGYKQSEYFQKLLTDFIHPDDLPDFLQYIEKIQNPGESLFLEQRILHKDGHYVWCEGTITNMLHQKEINAIVSNFNDITDRKAIEQQRNFDKNNLDALINNTNDLMWSIDKDMHLLTFNQSFGKRMRETTGKEVEKGASIFPAGITAKQLRRYRDYYQRALAGEQFSEVEYVSSPIEHWSYISFAPIRNNDKVVGIACHSRDVTESKILERNLRQNSIRLKESQSTAQLGHWEFDYKSQRVLWSEETCNIFDVKPEDNHQTFASYSSFIHPEDLQETLDAMAIAEKTLTEVSLDHRIVTRAGIVKYVCSKCKYDFDKKGKLTGMSGIVQDVTELRRTERQLRKSESFNRGILNTLSSHIAVINRVGLVVGVNDSWRKYAEENGDPQLHHTGVGSNYFKVCESAAALGDEISIEVLKGIKDVLNGDKPLFSYEYPCHSPTQQRWFAVRVLKFDGDDSLVVVSHQDITSRKLAQEKLLANNAALLKTNKELDHFVYSVSHDLRSPLTSILGLATFIEEETQEPDTLEHITMIKSGINRLDDFIKNILKYSQNNRSGLDISQIAVRDTIDEIVFSLKNMKDAAGIDFIVKTEGRVNFNSDMTRFRTIVENLVSNAIKYHNGNPTGRYVKISASVDKDFLELEIADNGIGIPEKFHSKIFDIFFRISGKVDGSGVGLYIVKEVVEKLEGTISVTSEEGVGTTFRLKLKNQHFDPN